jgi:Rrf2 family protein
LLQITKRVDYALVALSHLALHPGERQSARGLADAYFLSQTLMANVLKQLAKAELVSSSRGTKGGYELSEDPERIPVGRVVELLEGPLRLAECVHSEEEASEGLECAVSGICPVKKNVFQLHLKIRDLLYGESIADLVKTSRASALPLAAPKVSSKKGDPA